MNVTIYHNPACGTSRNTLELIRHAGIEPVVIEYRVISKHGEIVWLRDYMQPIWSDYENRVTHIIGAAPVILLPPVLSPPNSAVL